MSASGAVPLVEVEKLQTHFPVRKGLLRHVVGAVQAVDGVSFSIQKGQTLGLVGESGCGKTTVGRSILRLIEPTGGSVRFGGTDERVQNGAQLRGMRRRMQIIFQDPYGSLNPRMTVRTILEEGLLIHRIGNAAERLATVSRALERTGMSLGSLDRYPHEFSGGQRQRIAIARALVLEPEFLVLDEPISALDVSIQAQVVNLLVELREQCGLTYLFISHDLSRLSSMSPITWQSCILVESWSGRVPRSSTANLSTLTRWHFFRRCRQSIRQNAGGGSCSQATCRVRRGPRRGADSTPAAHWPSRCAASSIRRKCASTGIWFTATWRHAKSNALGEMSGPHRPTWLKKWPLW